MKVSTMKCILEPRGGWQRQTLSSEEGENRVKLPQRDWKSLVHAIERREWLGEDR